MIIDLPRTSENLKQLRKNHGYTQEDIAVNLSVTVQAISKWERGVSLPDICHLIELADLFYCHVEDLIITS